MKQTYYSLTNIMKKKALYNIIIGQRANGKTYSVISLIIKTFLKTGIPSAYIRRLDSELIPSTHSTFLTTESATKFAESASLFLSEPITAQHIEL